MPWFKSKPKRVHAEQFVDAAKPPRGVHPANIREQANEPYVITAQGQRVFVHSGEWIVDEGDGEHFYPITDDVFKGPKGYDPE